MRMEATGLHRVWLLPLVVFVVICCHLDQFTVFAKTVRPRLHKFANKRMKVPVQHFASRNQQVDVSFLNTTVSVPNSMHSSLTPKSSGAEPMVGNKNNELEIDLQMRELKESGKKSEKNVRVSAFEDSEVYENRQGEKAESEDSYEMIHFRRKSVLSDLSMNDRLKRHIFGKDSRVHLSSSLTQKFPFSAVVSIGTGCSGTLIWYRHVLTAAHCVHDGDAFFPLRKLKVGVLRESGTFKWFSVKRVFVANQWKRKTGLNRLGHDYAVIELNKYHGREYMRFGFHPAPTGKTIQFAGFPDDKPVHEMWFSSCRISMHKKRLLFNSCDAMPGMSGSGVYIYEKKRPRARGSSKFNDFNRKLVAILSSFRGKYKNGRFTDGHNLATRLTKKKVERICHWIKAGRGCRWLRN